MVRIVKSTVLQDRVDCDLFHCIHHTFLSPLAFSLRTLMKCLPFLLTLGRDDQSLNLKHAGQQLLYYRHMKSAGVDVFTPFVADSFVYCSKLS
jgi:hypothetical protein